MRPIRRDTVAVAALLLLALALRTGAVLAQRENLADDRDAYRAIAANLAAGNGFSVSDNPAGHPQPTAYRPPLYPLLLAGVFLIGGGEFGIDLLHVLLGGLTVLLTYLIARRIGLGAAAWLAAALVAVDPLLIQYATFPMTETLCAFLVTLLLAVLVGVGTAADGTPASVEEAGRSTEIPGSSPSPANWTRWRSVLAGIVFGLCALARPTIWAFLPLAGVCWLWQRLRARRTDRPPIGRFPAAFVGVGTIWPAVLGAAVVIAPWGVRNYVLFSRPIVTTTHGGYTLLLGNNPVFYREVVARPWGTVWEDAAADRTQAAWLKGVEAELRKELGRKADDEPSRDRWMYRRAVGNIAAEPGLFPRACWLRFRRFWNVVPLGPARGTLPAIVVWAVGLIYGVITAAFLAGLASLCVSQSTRSVPDTRSVRDTEREGRPARGTPTSVGWPLIWPVLLIAAFCLVHLFFWSNTRMRAPVVPMIALVAGEGCRFIIRRREGRPTG